MHNYSCTLQEARLKIVLIVWLSLLGFSFFCSCLIKLGWGSELWKQQDKAGLRMVYLGVSACEGSIRNYHWFPCKMERSASWQDLGCVNLVFFISWDVMGYTCRVQDGYLRWVVGERSLLALVLNDSRISAMQASAPDTRPMGFFGIQAPFPKWVGLWAPYLWMLHGLTLSILWFEWGDGQWGTDVPIFPWICCILGILLTGVMVGWPEMAVWLKH